MDSRRIRLRRSTEKSSLLNALRSGKPKATTTETGLRLKLFSSMKMENHRLLHLISIEKCKDNNSSKSRLRYWKAFSHRARRWRINKWRLSRAMSSRLYKHMRRTKPRRLRPTAAFASTSWLSLASCHAAIASASSAWERTWSTKILAHSAVHLSQSISRLSTTITMSTKISRKSSKKDSQSNTRSTYKRWWEADWKRTNDSNSRSRLDIIIMDTRTQVTSTIMSKRQSRMNGPCLLGPRIHSSDHLSHSSLTLLISLFQRLPRLLL